jgi:hypothetical protein
MSLLSLLLNVLWLLFGGIWMAVGWVVAAVLMAVTIIGLPWARAALTIALYTLLPFGHTVIPRDLDGREDLGTGPLGFIGNLIWLVLAGWWLAIGHIVIAVGAWPSPSSDCPSPGPTSSWPASRSGRLGGTSSLSRRPRGVMAAPRRLPFPEP